MRPDAHRWIRSDAARFLAPGTDPASVYPALIPVETKYSPNQPRVPAGNGDESGRWTDGRGTLAIPMGNVGIDDPRVISDATPDNFWAPGTQLANIIPVCILSGVSRTVNYFGLKEFSAFYDCANGQTIRRSGLGHSPPGIIRDPFR